LASVGLAISALHTERKDREMIRFDKAFQKLLGNIEGNWLPKRNTAFHGFVFHTTRMVSYGSKVTGRTVILMVLGLLTIKTELYIEVSQEPTKTEIRLVIKQ
jgi:hypothetical protein